MAGIAYRTDEGFAYRGATRTTFGTRLYEAGVDLRTAQELMRHTDPALTARVYQRVRLVHTRAGVEKQGTMGLGEAARDSGAALGCAGARQTATTRTGANKTERRPAEVERRK